MIFIGLFGFIAVIIVGLNMYNDSNLETIENYLKSQKCETIIYSKGSYKSLCDDKILEISNSFSVDIEKNSKTYIYDKIKIIETKDLNLILNSKDKIRFSTKEELSTFKENLQNKLK